MKYIVKVQAIVMVSVIILSACGSKKEEKQHLQSGEIIAVKTVRLQSSESSDIISSTGLITTENEAKYAFKTGGIIDKIYVSEGQFFKKGELLASLKLTEIDAGVMQAKLGLEKAQRDYQRMSNLYKDSVVTLEQLQNTKTELDLAQKQLDPVGFNRKYAFIYSANAGFVTKKLASEGEVVAGGHPVFAINENAGASWVLRAGLSDKEWASINLGNKATLSIDAFPDQIFKGVVSEKSQAADQNSGTFQVEIKIEMGNNKPAVGMYAKARIENANKSNYTSIPYNALIEADGNKAFVFVPFNKTRVKKLPITIQSFDNTTVKIASGLENVDEVIISNSAFLNEKSIINIIK